MLKEFLLSRLGTLGGGNKWERRRRFRCTDGSESLLEGNEGGWLGRRGRGTRLVERRRSIPAGNSGEAVEVVGGDDLIGDRLGGALEIEISGLALIPHVGTGDEELGGEGCYERGGRRGVREGCDDNVLGIVIQRDLIKGRNSSNGEGSFI